MPLYLYSCVRHGDFEKIAPVTVAGNPQPCPTCSAASPRTYCAVAVISDTSLFTGDRLDRVDAQNVDLDEYRKKANAAGVVTRGKQYISQLANEPGDPSAWVDSRSEMKKLAMERGLNMDGIVKVKHEQTGPAPRGLCPKIARREARRLQRERPGLSDANALGQAIEIHAPRGAKRLIEKPGKRPAKKR